MTLGFSSKQHRGHGTNCACGLASEHVLSLAWNTSLAVLRHVHSLVVRRLEATDQRLLGVVLHARI